MEVTVNGKVVELEPPASGADLLQVLGIASQTAVAEVNGVHVPRSIFLERQLCGGDRIELLSLVGGG